MSYYWEASVTTARTRIVLCEECETEYVYRLEVTGNADTSWAMSWSANTEEKALKKAKKDLKENLKYTCRAIPCPECALVQKHMITTAQHEFAQWGYISAIALVGIAVVGWIIAKITDSRGSFETIGLILLGVGIVVGVASYLVAIMHDPNKVSKKSRYAVADKECQRREEFEQSFADENADSFDKKYKSLKKKHAEGKSTEFPVPFWADKDQVREGVNRKVSLPTDEVIRIRLESGMKNGEEFEMKRNVDGVPVLFVCCLNIYTETRVKPKK